MNGSHSWGHPKVSNILQKHCSAIDDRIPIVCQSSSIGYLGPNIESWVQQDFINSMRKDCSKLGIRQFPPFKMIYPSLSNVKNSHDNLIGGGCLPYSKATNDRQLWLQDYLYQWRSNILHRSKAMPHIKCYTRFNLNDKCIYWFLLTSANLSKAAWGCYSKTLQPTLRIRNYEAGVLFIPKIMVLLFISLINLLQEWDIVLYYFKYIFRLEKRLFHWDMIAPVCHHYLYLLMYL